MKLSTLLVSGAMTLAAIGAHAATVTLDFPTQSGIFNTYSEDGFTVAGNFGNYSLTSGTLFPRFAGQQTRIFADDGSNFDVISLDVGVRSPSLALDFYGLDATGQVFSQNVVVSSGISNLQNVTFGAEFTGLTEFYFFQGPTVGANDDFVIDNVVLNAIAPVPVPASALLMGTALVAFGASRRARKSK